MGNNTRKLRKEVNGRVHDHNRNWQRYLRTWPLVYRVTGEFSKTREIVIPSDSQATIKALGSYALII